MQIATITTRAAQAQDRERCLWIEAGATPNLRYINDTWDLFTRSAQDELILAELDGTPCGFGQFTKLYGSYGWLEALRVHPDFQGQGLGKAIYKRYLEKMAEVDVGAIGMYTGVTNAVSKGLAERFGLSVRGQFAEYTKAVPTDGADILGAANVSSATDIPSNSGTPSNSDASNGSDIATDGFRQVAAADGEALLAPHYAQMGGFVAVNRTFFPVRAGLGENFAARGWLFADEEDNLLCAGARFQPEKALHIAFLHGDGDKLLRFAAKLARRSGAALLNAARSSGDEAQALLFTQQGFTRAKGEIITLWKGL
jgi:ribosomal protein S18 acetylase RimI-like enzyme